MRTLLASLSCLLLVLLASSCGDGNKPAGPGPASVAPKPSAGAKLTLAVIPKGTTHEFWKTIHAGAIKAAQEDGVEIIWKGPLKEDDRAEQIKVVENFMTENVSGIVLAPLDDVALAKPVAEAKKAKIPTVIIDSGLKSQDIVSFVATDNYKGGFMGGEYLAKLLGKKGKVILLRYNKGSASTEERERGFLDAMAQNPEIKVVSSNQEGGVTADSARKASESMLGPLTQSDGALTIDGIFCPNEPTTFGMLRALQGIKQTGKVKFVGFDASEALLKALEAGDVQGLVVQDPFRMGYLGVKTIVSHLKGQKVEAMVDTGVKLVSKENLGEQEIKDLLHPPLKQYLKE